MAPEDSVCAPTRFDAIQHAVAASDAGGALLIEITLWVCGALCLLWVGAAWVDAALYQQRAEASLAAATTGQEPPQATARVAPAVPGDPLATLRVPHLGLEAVVAEGTSPDVLALAIGRLRSSAAIGSDGNIVLAAHRDSFFRRLGLLERGDLISLVGPRGDALYRVQWTRIVAPDDTWVTVATGYPALTLITCYPFEFVGPAPRRYIVRAARLEPSLPAATRS